MGDDFSIDLNLKNLPPRSSVGKVGGSPQSPGAEKLKKSVGDPPPRPMDLSVCPEQIQKAFSYGGILAVIKRKLNALTGEKYTLVPAQGDRVCIDDKGQVHVGLLFLETYLNTPPVLAGVLAHEWGHFPTRRKLPNLDSLTWDEVYRLRREEETKADMFCGRALVLLGYPVEPLLAYLKANENPKEKSPKYHTVQSRIQIIVRTYRSQAARNKMAGNIKIDNAVYGDPIHLSKLIGS